MNTQDTRDTAHDEALRALLAGIDPQAGAPAPVDPHLLDRVLADAAEPEDPTTTPARAPAGSSFLRRHWQGSLLVAASVATLALAAPTALGGLTTSGDDAAVMSAGIGTSEGGLDSSTSGPVARDGAVAGVAAPNALADAAQGAAPPSAADQSEQTLVRSGSVLVGTDDVAAGRDSFVAAVLGMGGRIVSETVTSEGGGGAGEVPYAADTMTRSDMGASYPYPWYPQGPGIWLTVEVPAKSYEQAIEAARSTGEVVQMQQSSYDVGTQITDVDARIKALESSLARLTALMDDATGISDVIELESAIAARQAELDALRAQQRELANQTSMSGISLTLMSPQDARGTIDPNPELSWWESFTEGLSQFWGWLGHALVIVSPLLLAGAIIWWARLRRGRGARRRGGEGTVGEQPSSATD